MAAVFSDSAHRRHTSFVELQRPGACAKSTEVSVFASAENGQAVATTFALLFIFSGYAEKEQPSPISSKMGCIWSRKLAVLAEVALALARNWQAPGPLETLKLSS